MALAQRMELRQGQGLRLAPRLLQAISLLQLSQAELEAYLLGALEQNPLLQIKDAAPAPATGPRSGADRATARGAVILAETLEGSLARPRTLRDHLEQQAGMAGFDPADRLTASLLIDAVDESGYLRLDLAEVAGRLNLGLDRVARVLDRLQGFEPAGVFARDVRECLMLQLKDQGRMSPAMGALLDRLDLVARGDLPGLRRACGAPAASMRPPWRSCWPRCAALSPSPARAMAASPPPLSSPTPWCARRATVCGGWS